MNVKKHYYILPIFQQGSAAYFLTSFCRGSPQYCLLPHWTLQLCRMPLEIASSMESLTGAAVSKTKISTCILFYLCLLVKCSQFYIILEACNKNILLWRIFEHKNPNHWSELDLKNVYMYEVQPQGYTFPFDQIIRSLHYERFVKDIKGEVGRHTYTININKVINYVKKIQPIAPPPASPKKNKCTCS